MVKREEEHVKFQKLGFVNLFGRTKVTTLKII